jgi:hypothetical protein
VGETLLVGLTMVRNEAHYNHTAWASERAVAVAWGRDGKKFDLKLRFPSAAPGVLRRPQVANTPAQEVTAVLTDS